jgi:hypothetical protein
MNPSYLPPGQAKDEVQRVTVAASVEGYSLENRGTGLFERVGEGEHVKLTKGETPKQVQEALEGKGVEGNEMFGKGNVEVTEVSPEAYDVRFVGELTDLPVSPMGGREAGIKELAKGRPDGEIVLTAVNLGDANASPKPQPVTVSDILPPGLRAVAIEAAVDENLGLFGKNSAPFECSLASSKREGVCTFTGELPPALALLYPRLRPEGYPKFVPPYELIRVRVAVNLAGASSGEANVAAVSGGGAPAATARQPITVSETPPPFGVSAYEVRPEAEGGGLDTQAGSHPFQLTTTFNLNEGFEPKPVGLAKDLHFKLPAGLIGNPTAVPRCALADFLAPRGGNCPAQTVVGIARTTVNLFNSGHALTPFAEPLYNLEPAFGEPARFGFLVEGTPVLLTTAVRTGGDYGVTVNVANTTEQIEFLSSEVTFWGVPGDEAHNNARGLECLAAATDAAQDVKGPTVPTCPAFSEQSPSPLLSLPTSCTGSPLQTSVEADSWEEPRNVLSFSSTAPLVTLDGCNRLPFEPQIKVTPDGQQASKPTGLTVDVHVPQEGQLNATGLAQSNIKEIKVTLPEGVTLNPAAGDGLQACSEAQIGYLAGESHPPSDLRFTPKLPGSFGSSESLQPGVNFCPDASKIATVRVKTPLLPNALEGAVYLASPQNFQVFPQENPFETHVAMYVVAEDPVSGSLVKLPGRVALNEATGQIEATFKDSPQLPFEDAELHFFGGERAPLASPSRCGSYTTNATYTPWSGGEPVHSSSSFEVTSGPNGTPCPGASLPFNPSLASGTTNNNAGSFSDLTTTLSREDGQQSIQSVTLHYPAGVSGLLSGVKLCPEAQANEGACGPESQIGETIVSVGLGGDPFTVTGGKVYITGPYRGAPFGLSIVNPAKAGPFNLQEGRPVVVRAKVEVNPVTAALTVTTDPPGSLHAIPTIIEGFPLQIKHVNVLVNRPGFAFNPTSCSPMVVTGAIESAEGASSPVSVPFQVANCAVLKFAPKFAVSTAARTSKANGASLAVKLTYPNGSEGTYANIARVKVELPKALPSRLTTLQKACANAQFEANPAGCPAASIVGHAKAITPLIPVPLEGPAYFVSHGGEAFPSLIIVLQGYGVTIDLVGTTFINKAGVTSSTFKTVPDAPVGSFELTLPQGRFSALAANGNLCKTRLVMPTEFVAQNGAALSQNTHIEVEGCSNTLGVISRSVSKRTLKLSVYVPAAGRLTASGRGVGRASKTSSGSEAIELTLHTTKSGRFSTKIKLSFVPARLQVESLRSTKERRQTKSLKVTFTK